MSEQTERSLFKTTLFDIFKSDLSPQQVELAKKEFSGLNDYLLFVFVEKIMGRENKKEKKKENNKMKWSIVMNLIKLLTSKTTSTPKQLRDELAKLQSLELSSDENEALQALIKLKQF
ncbi:hypothetical protein RFI_31088 [Reticulomyxa filosa]|uniref:Uncharacterized protein n=1 Tax=Reticulomyxa filosa TaxID=46433 RepID=X6LYS3_RETFI|nr:hypothetical protein RFI_31088 [Reticulomyxa filosa]|eukprot:ETO06307.1 hypothetical protein RFI_31088 [Reticulomyxa filosa]